MKKMFFAIITMLALSRGVNADPVPVLPASNMTSITPPTTVVFPTTAQNAFLGNQVIATIINHGTILEEYRSGQKEITLQDNVIEFGHLNAQYVASIFGGIYQNPTSSNLGEEAGLKLNLNAILNKFLTFAPNWTWLGNVEYAPSLGYDFGKDHTHAWFAGFSVGVGFGDGSGVTTASSVTK